MWGGKGKGKGDGMETILLNDKMILVKSDDERDIADVIEFIEKRGKDEAMDKLLKFAAEHRFIEKDYKFNRDELYDR